MAVAEISFGRSRRSFAAMSLVAQKTDPRYAERLRRAVVTRFLDTNEFSLTDVPKEERVLIGAGTTRRLGSRHNPEVARAALDESRNEVEQLARPTCRGGDRLAPAARGPAPARCFRWRRWPGSRRNW